MNKLYSRLGWFTAGIITGVVGVFVYQVFGREVEPEPNIEYWDDDNEDYRFWCIHPRITKGLNGDQIEEAITQYQSRLDKTQPIYTGGD